jgi:hypothetical protein
LPAAATLFVLAHHVLAPPYTMRGPAQAAAHVMQHSAKRILYCGLADGHFIFAVRALDPELQAVVIRGDKLAPETFTPGRIEDFAHHHGIDYVVLERTAGPQPWSGLWYSLPPTMVVEKELAMTADPYLLFNGVLRIYRFTNPSRAPTSFRQMPLGERVQSGNAAVPDRLGVVLGTFLHERGPRALPGFRYGRARHLPG